MSAKPTVVSWLLTTLVYGLLGPLIGVSGFLLLHDADYARMQHWGPLAQLLTAVLGFFVGLIPAVFTGLVMGGLRAVPLWMRIVAAPAIGGAVTFLTGLLIIGLGPHDAGDVTLICCGGFAAGVCAVLVGAVEAWRDRRTARA